jgi:hypothetical protein
MREEVKSMTTYDFDFLKNSRLLRDQQKATQKIMALYQAQDWPDLAVNLRKAEESLVNLLYQVENLDLTYFRQGFAAASLSQKLDHLRAQGFYPYKIMDLFYDIKRLGNQAAHAGSEITAEQARQALAAYHDLLVFVVNTYEGQRADYASTIIQQEFVHHQADWYRPRDNQLQASQLAESQRKIDRVSHWWNGKTMTIIKWVLILILLLLIAHYFSTH